MQTKRRTKKKQMMEGKMLSCSGEIWAQVWLHYNIVQSFESKFNSSIYSGKEEREKERSKHVLKLLNHLAQFHWTHLSLDCFTVAEESTRGLLRCASARDSEQWAVIMTSSVSVLRWQWRTHSCHTNTLSITMTSQDRASFSIQSNSS